jgi:hypothetical protein
VEIEAMLPKEDEQSEELRRLLQQSYRAPAPSDRFVKRLEERLMAMLPIEKQATITTRPRNRISKWFGGYSMPQRITLGIVAVTILLGLFLVWQGFETKPLSAMEQMAENIRKAKSYKCTQTIQFTSKFPAPGKPATTESRIIFYCFTTGSTRAETTKTSPQTWKGPGPESTEIRPAGKPGIGIDHRDKTYILYPPTIQRNPHSGLDDLVNFIGETTQDMGIQEIDGRKTHAYRLDMKNVDEDMIAPGNVELWIDVETYLPVRVCHHWNGFDFSMTEMDTDFQWDIEPKPELLDTKPPEGYADATPKPLAPSEQIGKITDALKIFRDECGYYPRPKKDFYYPTIVEELCKKLGLNKLPIRGTKDGKEGLAATAMKGFEELEKIQQYNPDFSYNGQTVTSNDKDKVLLRWKLDDGRYEVIFGDLRAETVTAERLRMLEGK